MKTNKSLNELFHSASAETEGGVPSQSEVERLLRNSEVRSVPVTTNIGQWLYERLLSTPLRIGITSMTTAACIALGIIAFWPQASSQPSNKVSTVANRTAKSNRANERQIPLLAGIGQPPQFTTHGQTASAQPAHAHAHAQIPATPIAAANSLHPLDLSEAQLAKLGIVLQADGDIDFYVGDGLMRGRDSDCVSHYGFTSSGGFRIHFLTRGLLTEKDLPQLHILSAAPKLITATTGAKRLFSFDNNSSNNVPRYHTEVLKSFPSGNGKTDVLPVFDDDSALQASVNTIPENRRTNREIILKRVLQVKSGEQKPLDTVSIQRETVRISDSLGTTIREREVKFSNDSSEALPPFPDEIDSLNRRTNNPANNYSDSEYNSFLHNLKALNRLIPIRIRNLNNHAHPNELIFWYDPTPEVLAAVPQAMAARSEAVTMQVQTVVYPNPTNGRATLRFELMGTNRGHYTVRNLLGQEVMSGGTLSGSTGEVPLDLSKLDAGVYLLVTTTVGGVPDVERVVVAK